jgi:hypothetical protein
MSRIRRVEAAADEIERLRNKLNQDSQNFQIECQKAEIELLRRELANAREALERDGGVWRKRAEALGWPTTTDSGDELDKMHELLRRVLAEDGLRPSTEAAITDYLRAASTVTAVRE